MAIYSQQTPSTHRCVMASVAVPLIQRYHLCGSNRGSLRL